MPLLEYFGIVPKHFATWCGYSLAAAAWGMWHVRLKAAATSQTSATLPHVPRQPASCAPHKTAESRRHVTVVIRLARANSLRTTSSVIQGIPFLAERHVIFCPSYIYENGLAAAAAPGQHPEAIQRLRATEEGDQGCVHHKCQSYTDCSGTTSRTPSY
jgi:hypothetical protein